MQHNVRQLHRIVVLFSRYGIERNQTGLESLTNNLAMLLSIAKAHVQRMLALRATRNRQRIEQFWNTINIFESEHIKFHERKNNIDQTIKNLNNNPPNGDLELIVKEISQEQINVNTALKNIQSCFELLFKDIKAVTCRNATVFAVSRISAIHDIRANGHRAL